MGNRALHDTNGMVRMVNIRSFLSAMVRVAMMAGTVQPKPVIIGTMLFPLKPTRDRNRSMTIATLSLSPFPSLPSFPCFAWERFLRRSAPLPPPRNVHSHQPIVDPRSSELLKIGTSERLGLSPWRSSRRAGRAPLRGRSGRTALFSPLPVPQPPHPS